MYIPIEFISRKKRLHRTAAQLEALEREGPKRCCHWKTNI